MEAGGAESDMPAGERALVFSACNASLPDIRQLITAGADKNAID
jgi:hypothetical protein